MRYATRRLLWWLIVTFTVAACGDNIPAQPDGGADATARCVDLGCFDPLAQQSCNENFGCTCAGETCLADCCMRMPDVTAVKVCVLRGQGYATIPSHSCGIVTCGGQAIDVCAH